MQTIDWLPLCATVLALGMRHGLDADHLAAIDGLTRYNSQRGSSLARWCGVLFSLGHGSVVILVAATVGAAAAAYHVPEWARAFGAWVSILFLVAVGLLNLRTVLRTPVDEMVPLVGVRSGLFPRLMRTAQPMGIVAIGVLFAISFDTLSQAVFFAAIATQFGAVRTGVVLGLLFLVGMLLVDGANGAWIAGLLKRQDRRARMASRAVGLLVALLSFGVAALGVVRYFSRVADAALDGRELALGVVIALVVALGITLTGRLARYREDAGAGCPPVPITPNSTGERA